MDSSIPLSFATNILTINLSQYIGYIVVMLVFVILSAFFSLSETVFSNANELRLQTKAEKGSTSAQKALQFIENYDQTITTILVGNNIVNIALSTVATVFFIKLLENTNASNMAEVISTIVITAVVLIFGEITPKTIAKPNADSLATKISYILEIFRIILWPLSSLFSLYQRLLHKKDKDAEPQVNEEELEQILETMEDEGAIESDELEAIKNVLDLNDREVKDIMTPRPDIVCININSTISDVAKMFSEEKFSRVPVFEEDKDHIVGILYEHDFLTTYLKNKDVKIKELMRKPLFVSGSMKVDDFIHELQRKKMHMAIVSGVYGEVVGIATMEDALEELVGEIYDEHDEEELPVLITKVNENEYILNPEIYLDYLFDELDLGNPPDTNYSKLSGWLFSMCEDIPEEGFNYEYISKYIDKDDDEKFTELTKKLTFVVTKVTDRRIEGISLFVEDIESEEE